MYRLKEVTEPVFARHETFHPRYGWFRKGVKASSELPDVFTTESAPVELGVGKNMVRAIRFWGRAAKVLVDPPPPQQPRAFATRPSRNGVVLLDEGVGLDPYLELSGSLWLLHWWMLAPPCLLPVWWLAFNQFEPIEFSDDILLSFVLNEIEYSGWPSVPVIDSIKKDVDCLLRMYATHSGRLALDDIIDCPFRELGLIEPVWGEKRRFRFVLGPKPTVPPAIVAYACLDYLSTIDASSRTSTVSRLLQPPGSPGRAFKLTEEALVAALVAYSSERPSIQVTTSAGIPQLAIDGDLREQSAHALRTYYRQSGVHVDSPLLLGIDASEMPDGLFSMTSRSKEQ